LPHLQKLQKEYEKRGVVVLAVNFGDQAETISTYFEREGFTFSAVRQSKDEISRAFGVRVYPTLYVIDAEGRIAWRGAGLDEPMLRAVLDK
jgi:thiol-disulfide isomerase/thioredoxin